jgi:hypothetical protein
MAICPHCGKSSDAPREKVPWWKYDPGGPTVGLGCGTLVLIGIIVAIFTPRSEDLAREVRDLRSEVGGVKKEVEAQSSAIRQLRDRLPAPAKAEDAKGK